MLVCSRLKQNGKKPVECEVTGHLQNDPAGFYNLTVNETHISLMLAKARQGL